MSGYLSKKMKASKVKPFHLKFGHQGTLTGLDKAKKLRPKKDIEVPKYEMLKKSSVPDYTDVAYREAVTRLRYLLNESYVPPASKYAISGFKLNEIDEENRASPMASERTKTARLSPFRRPYLSPRHIRKPRQTVSGLHSYGDDDDLENKNLWSGSPELLAFVERQEEYIDQLEKEAQYCRDELSHLLGKVKELISENESLQDQQKAGLMKVMFEGMDEERLNENQSPKKYRKQLEGPLIVFESRISELEAQLTQSRLDLRKAQEEAEMYKKKLEDCHTPSSNYDFYKQIENLQREKRDLNESLAKLQASINQIREKEMDASKKVQRTLDVVDKTQFEKQQAEMEVYRLKSELELQHDKLLEVLSEQTRKVADERSQAERRYQQHVERLNAELTAQRDSSTKLQMELEKHQRLEEDLKRDLSAKNMTIENVKKELNNKIATLQMELSGALAERDSLEQELTTSRMSTERAERMNKQEASRLQVEISALKKRLDGGDAELIHSRRENLRLLEKISNLENELTLYKIKLGEQKDPIEEAEEKAREKIMNSRISEIEAKHVEKVSELEGLIENQSQVMAQLKAECQSLTQKLEESTARHKEEMESLQGHLNKLNNKMDSSFSGNKIWSSDKMSKEPETAAGERNRYQVFGDERKINGTRSTDNFNQSFLENESQKSSGASFDAGYNGNQSATQQNNASEFSYGNVYDDGYEGNSNGGKPESQNTLFDNQSNSYSSIHYAGDQKPISNYSEQQSFQNQNSSPVEHPSHQEQSPHLEKQVFKEQAPHQEQQQQQHPAQSSHQGEPSLRDSTNQKDRTVTEETYGTISEVSVQPAQPSAPASVESQDRISQEQKPPSEAPKTTPSQRFQRAAELSRQTRSDDSSRGRLLTQARTRNSQISRTQPKPSSRFK